MIKQKLPLMNKENDNTNAYGTGLSVKKRHGRKNAVVECTVTTPKAVPHDQHKDAVKFDDSSPKLVIDISEEIFSSQSITTDNASQN
ncbi:unnamed protein product [Rotaria magnacalcarata]|uniref:Uncharacterized protein n=1 Tax=Rotaria magnacalcarata TaxID=392030 RepID=A0A8S3GS06_9BILA|nr:unnamed protein product [Rotaria magnacalcarata]